MKSSLVATGNRTCLKGWLKPALVDSFNSLWASSTCSQHNRKIADQIDSFNWELHCELSSVASMLKTRTGLLAGDFFARIVYTEMPHDSHYRYWNVLENSTGAAGHNVLSVRLYQSPTNPTKMAVVFETTLGLVGKASWDFDQLEVFSEEL
ncbi:TPA: hypothetical protein ACGSTL_001341 [Vibrio parahaemolyticus]|uniref:hypothetical protein n=1 Tax=Vibrio campbellii TaxID=680 RepID=UPI001F07EDF6|nr:hypothetical protein [Vibrio campbellii]UMM06786.1 hypothetical protein MKR81_26360 [Vibrio campbellii]